MFTWKYCTIVLNPATPSHTHIPTCINPYIRTPANKKLNFTFQTISSNSTLESRFFYCENTASSSMKQNVKIT